MGGSVSKMVELAEWFCGSANLGYDQWNRWDFPVYGDAVTPGECDCSSLVYHCAELAGFGVPKSGTRYTGTMHRDFQAAGFIWHADTGTSWKAGDILYKEGHTAIWTGKYIAEAYGDERGGSRGGARGDQNNETRLSPKRGGWKGYFRYCPPVPKPDPKRWENMWIETGGNGVPHAYQQERYAYTYEKREDGTLIVTISDWYNAGVGKTYGQGYFMEKTLEFPSMVDEDAPAFIEPPSVFIQLRANQNLMSASIHGISTTRADFWAFGTQRAIPKFYADALIIGRWK